MDKTSYGCESGWSEAGTRKFAGKWMFVMHCLTFAVQI